MLVLPQIGLIKPPRQDRSRATVDAILTATQQLTVRDGFGALNTTQIAERAGVGIGSLYQYFDNKEAILVELARQAMQRTALSFDACLRSEIGRPLEDSVAVLVHEFTGSVSRAPHRFRYEMLQWLPPASGKADTSFRNAYLQQAERFLLPHARHSDARGIGYASISVLATIDGILDATGRAEEDLLADKNYVRQVSQALVGVIRNLVG